MNFTNTNGRLFALSVAVLIIYHLPLFSLGENTYILIFDNLESSYVFPNILIENSKVFARSDIIIPQLNIPRIVLGTEFNLIIFLNYLLSPLYAYLAGFAITHTVAFIGMYLLLRNHFLSEPENDYINIMVSLCFALLPFLPAAGISVAGQPLALYSFLNFRSRNQSIKDWLILLLIPFYSSIVYAFVFFLTAVGLTWFYDLIRKRDYNPTFLLSIVFMSLTFLLIEYRLLLFQINPFFISHRFEFGVHHFNNLSLPQSIYRAILHFIMGNIHALSLQRFFVGVSLILTLAISILTNKNRPQLGKTFYTLLISTLLISIFYGVYNSSAALQIKNSVPLLRMFDFSRFDWLAPLLWHLVFALSLRFITKTFTKIGKPLVYAFIIGQVFFCFYMSNFAMEMRNNSITYKEFFAEEQFKEIGNYIGEPKNNYRVISIGLHPSIALFNGFHTADFYLNNYPLRYKHSFRKIIAKEIEKDPDLEQYYDQWGSRVYAFTNDLKRDYTGEKTSAPIKNLDFDTKAMRELGIKYVISRVPIESPFIFMKNFSHPDSAWDIYLYRVPAY